MKKSEILTKARNLLADPAKWTQHAYAMNATGQPTSAVGGGGRRGPPACFCSLGALRHVTGLNEDGPAATFLQSVSADVNGLEMHEYNDGDETTHAGVLSTFDEAIKRAQRIEEEDARQLAAMTEHAESHA